MIKPLSFESFEMTAKFILFVPLGYFIQAKKLLAVEKNFSTEMLAMGIFFSLFALSLYLKGGMAVFGVLEIMVFFTIAFDAIRNNSADLNHRGDKSLPPCFRVRNLVLQGLGSGLILVALLASDVLSKNLPPDGQPTVMGAIFMVVDVKAALSLALLLGILLKSTMLEYSISTHKMAIYRVILKLYFPLRILFENGPLQILELSEVSKWAILVFCLVNGLGVIIRRPLRWEILQSAQLLGGLMLLAIAVTGGGRIEILAKYGLGVLLILVFYWEGAQAKQSRLFGMVLLMLSATVIVRAVYLLPNALAWSQGGRLWAAGSAVVLYLTARHLWGGVADIVRARREQRSLDYDYTFLGNILALVFILLLTEVDIGYLLRGTLD